jgi:hypothetical protein
LTIPLRIQRRRTKGWHKPPNTIICTRPSRYGNIWRVGRLGVRSSIEAVRAHRRWIEQGEKLRRLLPENEWPPTIEEIRRDLSGRNLACWCHLCPKHAAGKPFHEICPDCAACHTDFLGMVANPKK